MARTPRRKSAKGVGRPITYTDEQLIEALQKLAKKIGHTPLAMDMGARNGSPPAGTYIRRFGSLDNAFERAGLPANNLRCRYTDEQLLEPLKNLAKELGHAPKIKESNSYKGTASTVTYIQRFGSWKNALEAAGLSSKDYCCTYTVEYLIESLRKVAKELGHTPTTKEMDNITWAPNYSTYIQRFGSWNDAIKKAKL